MKKIAFLIVVCTTLFSSCAKEVSENVAQDSIYTVYELFFNKNTDITTARATFRFGGPSGTLLDLTDPANCTFNGDELLYNKILGSHNKDYAGFVSSGTFKYLDLDDNTLTNTTPIIETIDFPTKDTIKADNPCLFMWIGSPLGKDESVSLIIDGTEQNNFELFGTVVEGATEIALSSEKLKRLGHGVATCTLTREYNKFSIDEGTSKGGRMAVWYTLEKNVFVMN